MSEIYYDECAQNEAIDMWGCYNLPDTSDVTYHESCSQVGAGALWGCHEYYEEDYSAVHSLHPDTVLHADRAIVEVVDHANVGVDVTIDANCVAASFLGKPCASSVHDSAIAIDQPDITITVDTQPIGDGIHSAAVTLAMTILLVVIVLKKFK